MESKLKAIIQNHLKTTGSGQNTVSLFETSESVSGKEFAENVSDILKVLAEIRFVDRPMKKAYLEEELQLTGYYLV